MMESFYHWLCFIPFKISIGNLTLQCKISFSTCTSESHKPLKVKFTWSILRVLCRMRGYSLHWPFPNQPYLGSTLKIIWRGHKLSGGVLVAYQEGSWGWGWVGRVHLRLSQTLQLLLDWGKSWYRSGCQIYIPGKRELDLFSLSEAK